MPFDDRYASPVELNTLRGFACVLLVLFHTVGNLPSTGLNFPDGHVLHEFNEVVSYVRMPVFALIAGYVYGFKPCYAALPQFLGQKARRLLVPVLTIGSLFAWMQSRFVASATAPVEWWMVHVYTVGHFWFLQSLFLIFVVIALLDWLGALSSGWKLAIAFTSSVLMFVSLNTPVYFGLGGAMYLLPFFLTGLACRRFKVGGSAWVVVAFTVLVMAGYYTIAFPDDAQVDGSPIGKVLIGVTGAFLLLKIGVKNQVLAFIGRNSFLVYLLHVFFTAGTRIILKTMGFTDSYALLSLGLTAGLVGPIVVAKILSHLPLIEQLLLGAPQHGRTPPPLVQPTTVAATLPTR